MSSRKESNPNDITTRRDQTDIETDSQASGTAKKGWFSSRNLIILGIAAVSSVIIVGLILFLILPSSTPSESPKAEALIGDFSTTMNSVESTKVTPSGSGVTSVTSSGSGVTSTKTKPSEEKSLEPVTSSQPPTLSESSTTVKTDLNDEPPKLIFAQALFRHGARAPDSGLSAEEAALHFPRGRGQLTDRGFNNSYLVGLFLKKRYVDSGFLNAKMVPEEMKWYARSLSRVLSTASTVGAAMFRDPKRNQSYTSVPVTTMKGSKDHLLNFPLSNCEPIQRYYEKTCPEFLKKKDKRVAAKCLNGGKMPPIFKIFNIRDSDKHINMVRNNIPVPQNVTDNYAEISAEYTKVRHFTNGIGAPEMIQVRFGVLVDTLLKDIRKAWKEHEANNQTLKFKVYSTQDWVMGGLLDGFGVMHHLLKTGPEEEPNYNVMVLIELWKKSNEKAFVKFLYKPEEVTKEDHVMMDLTKFVPGCDGMDECPRKKFNKCCDATRVNRKERENLCYPKGQPTKKPKKP